MFVRSFSTRSINNPLSILYTSTSRMNPFPDKNVRHVIRQTQIVDTDRQSEKMDLKIVKWNIQIETPF